MNKWFRSSRRAPITGPPTSAADVPSSSVPSLPSLHHIKHNSMSHTNGNGNGTHGSNGNGNNGHDQPSGMDTRADGHSHGNGNGVNTICSSNMSSTGCTTNSSTTIVAWSSSSSSQSSSSMMNGNGNQVVSSSLSSSIMKPSRTLLVAPPVAEQRTTANPSSSNRPLNGVNTGTTTTNGHSNGNGSNGNDSSRRRSAPPISARRSPKGQREYTDFMGHCHLSVPGRRRDLLIVIGCALDTVFNAPARKNDRLPADPKAITAFHSVSVPTMTIQAYFKRLTDHIDCSVECCVLAMVHINRIHTTKPNIPIDSLTIHRLLLTALMCSAKFFDDHVFNNSQWASIGGVSARELNSLEREFLSLMDYSLFVTPELYVQVYNELCNPLLHVKCPSADACKATQLYGAHPCTAPINRESCITLTHEQKTESSLSLPSSSSVASSSSSSMSSNVPRLLGLNPMNPTPNRRITMPPLPPLRSSSSSANISINSNMSEPTN